MTTPRGRSPRGRRARRGGCDGAERPPAREIELKLELAPADWKRLARHPLLKEALAAAGKAKRMEATYFDTPDQRLRAKGVSLRIRRTGAKRVQTTKAADGPAAGLFDRAEYETPVAGDAPDLTALVATPLAPLFTKRKIREGLAPAFTVSTRRRTISLVEGAFAAEMVIDEGTVDVGERAEPFLRDRARAARRRAGGPLPLRPAHRAGGPGPARIPGEVRSRLGARGERGTASGQEDRDRARSRDAGLRSLPGDRPRLPRAARRQRAGAARTCARRAPCTSRESRCGGCAPRFRCSSAWSRTIAAGRSQRS